MLFSSKDPVTVAQKLIASGNAISAELTSVLAQVTSPDVWRGRTNAAGKGFHQFR